MRDGRDCPDRVVYIPGLFEFTETGETIIFVFQNHDLSIDSGYICNYVPDFQKHIAKYKHLKRIRNASLLAGASTILLCGYFGTALFLMPACFLILLAALLHKDSQNCLRVLIEQFNEARLTEHN